MAIDRIGKYRVLAKLGQGGMARVLLTMAEGPHAFHKLLVVKELKDDLVGDPDFLAMFLDEARIAARLNHPNIVQTYEVGNEGERYFIAMEYLEGQPLNAIFRRVGRKNVPLEIHLRVLADVLSGLEHAHKLADFDGSPFHVVHRDVSPQNVFVTYEGQVKLVDFGIAKAAGASSTTKEGVMKGKISYVSPEQSRCEPVDSRADLFAVGVMLWEAVAERRLVHKEDEMSVLSRRMAGRDPSVRSVRPGVPADLAAICDRSMAPAPEDRFQTAREFRDVLERYLAQSDYRVSSNEVGRLVSDAFEDERVRIRGIVEDRVKHLDDAAEPISIELHPGSLGATSDSLVRVVQPGPHSETPAAGNQTALAQVIPPRRPRSRSLWPALAAVGVALIGAFGAAVYLAKTMKATPAATEAPAAHAAPAANTLSLSVGYPSEARLKLDGGYVDGNPFKATPPRDGSIHQLSVERAGFITETRTVTFDRDLDLSITLSVVAVAPPETAEPKPASGRPWRPSAKPAAAAEEPAVKKPPKPPAASVVIDEDNPYLKTK